MTRLAVLAKLKSEAVTAVFQFPYQVAETKVDDRHDHRAGKYTVR